MAQQAEIDKLKAALAQKELENEALRNQLAREGGSEPPPPPEQSLTGLEVGVASPMEDVDELYETVRKAMDFIIEKHFDSLHLTGIMRRRLQGAGERRWGSVEMTHQMSENDKQYYTYPLSSWEGLDLLIKNVLRWREVDELAERVARIARDHYLATSNAAYAMARMFYRNVQTAARAGDAGAQGIYNDLKTYYTHLGRRSNTGEPTIPEIETDVNALLHGRKDGKIVIEHEGPKRTKGRTVVVDDVHSKGMHPLVKATVSGTTCPHCNCENPHHHKFCCECGGKLIVGSR
jgi:hypothetical protein